MTFSDKPLCFYCSEYVKVAKDYPTNFATRDETTFTPRCFLHWKFKCSKCERMTHFNGISWCSSCSQFTCVHCTDEKLVRKEFFVYDYYYSIPCHKCGKENPALDFAEFEGTHPFQIGDLKPAEDVMVWVQIFEGEIEPQEFPHKAWGKQRILSLGNPPTFKKLESLDEYNPKTIWDNLASQWLTVEEENYHHKYKILPEVYRLLDVKKGDKVLDVACGKGDVARHLAKNGAKVTGIDISKMLDYAIQTEKKEKLGITYLKMNAEKLSEKFENAFFDKIVCNMALMDIEKYTLVIKQVSNLLREDGIFVFSISHPAFAFTSCTSIKIPEDSKRNEDKIRIVMNYFDETPTLFYYGFNPPKSFLALHFQRPISLYVNELVKNKLIIQEMCEPKASEELIERFPKNAYMDDDVWPDFLIMKTMKKLNL